MVLLHMLKKAAAGGLRAAPRRSALYSTERVFPQFSIYGIDSAFQVSPSAPQYVSTGSYLKTKRVGSIMLSWAKSTNTGYNYSNKTFFSLSPSEVGLVLELLDSRIPDLSFTHSPNMNASGDDKNAKSLFISREAGPEGNPMLLLRVSHESESVATLDVGETRVFRELLTYSLPRLLGFHSVLEGSLNTESPTGGGYSQGQGQGNGSSGGYRGGNSKPAGDWPF